MIIVHHPALYPAAHQYYGSSIWVWTGVNLGDVPVITPATTSGRLVAFPLRLGSSIRLRANGTTQAQVHVADVGTTFRATLCDQDDELVDLSDATEMTYVFARPDGTTFAREAQFTGDGTDGEMEYSLAVGDIDQDGRWQVQGYVETPSGRWHTSIQRFTVYPNLV